MELFCHADGIFLVVEDGEKAQRSKCRSWGTPNTPPGRGLALIKNSLKSNFCILFFFHFCVDDECPERNCSLEI